MKKRKYRKKKNIKIAIFLTLISLIIISSGYAIFSESLSIFGNSTLSDYHTNNILHLNLAQTNNRYTVNTPRRITFQSESFDEVNNIYVYYTKNDTTTLNRNNTFRINFSNQYNVRLENMTASAQVISGTFSNASATVSRVRINPGVTANFRLNTTHKNSTVGNGVVRVTVSGTLNGVTKYFYYWVHIS